MAPWTVINQVIPYCPFEKALFTVGLRGRGDNNLLFQCRAGCCASDPWPCTVCAACREDGVRSSGWHIRVELSNIGNPSLSLWGIYTLYHKYAAELKLPKIPGFIVSEWIITNRRERNSESKSSDKYIALDEKGFSTPLCFQMFWEHGSKLKTV